MFLNQGEHIIREYRHHPFPFMLQILKVVVLILPFYFLAYFMTFAVPIGYSVIVFSFITLIFILVIIYLALIYWLDKMVITNNRIILIDWHYLTIRVESEALLQDILDIHTKENGIFSLIPLFDFGTFRVETASQNTTLLFTEAPNPEGIKSFLYLYQQIRTYGSAIKKIVDIPQFA
jgi:hypothetical protein